MVLERDSKEVNSYSAPPVYAQNLFFVLISRAKHMSGTEPVQYILNMEPRLGANLD